jgi:Predicted ATP-dependent endonuclease of the OLD family
LHPVAVSNLLQVLHELTETYNNLTIIITSHSPEVIRKIKPSNLYKLERVKSDENNFNVVNPCYPSYAIRDVYTHDGFDFLLLVEDQLAKIIVNNSIKELGIQRSRLINVTPVGGWENVLKLQIELYTNNVLGVGKQVFCILDGDVKCIIPKQYSSVKKLFLPVNSMEKYLKKVLIEAIIPAIKKSINDSLFTVKSLDSLIADYKHSEHEMAVALGDRYKEDNDGKRLYTVLLKDVKSRNITEESFINILYSIIKENVDFSEFNRALILATK